MENIYLASKHQESFDSYVRKMQQFGEWGTDQEIVAAVNLFDCSIVCYSGEGKGHVTYFRNFGTPSISRERFELETSNLARTLTTRGTNDNFASKRP